MDLSIIIISYNTKELLIECLQSIYHYPPQISFEIIIVDNASTDGSPEAVSLHFPQINLIQNAKNVGFAIANNQAAQIANGKFLLFLNSDTIAHKASISQLVELATQHHADIASLQLKNPDGTLQPQGGALPGLANIFAWMTFLDDIFLTRWLFDPYHQENPKYFASDQRPGWLAGTALLVNSQVYQQISGFDPQMFMYGEDVDLCWRARQSGFSVHYFHTPSITHIGHGSGSSAKARISELSALQYLFQKHQSSWKMPILQLILKLGIYLRIMIFGIIKRDEQTKAIYQQALSVV